MIKSWWEIQYCRNSTTVTLPHSTKSSLSSKIPQFYGHISFCNFTHIKTHLGKGVDNVSSWYLIHQIILYKNNKHFEVRNIQLESCPHCSHQSAGLRSANKNHEGKKSNKNKIRDILTAMALTRDVFPAFWRPIRESSISCLKNKLKCTLINSKKELRSQKVELCDTKSFKLGNRLLE